MEVKSCKYDKCVRKTKYKHKTYNPPFYWVYIKCFAMVNISERQSVSGIIHSDFFLWRVYIHTYHIYYLFWPPILQDDTCVYVSDTA